VTIKSEIQKLNPSAQLELFEVDLTAQGDSVYYFHAGTNQLTQPVVWQGQTYSPWPAQSSGFDYNVSGQIPRPKLALANTTGAITALILATGDCVGAKVTRRRTLAKFLDAANFASGNPSADPNSYFPDEIFFIDRKATENKTIVEFELTAAFDVTGVQLPRRQIIQNLCPWRYRGGECGYVGTDYFKQDDTPTPVASQDVCGKRLTSCQARFGETEELPFGGFPGAGTVG
jgi:lambda family phage minor tail protein L